MRHRQRMGWLVVAGGLAACSSGAEHGRDAGGPDADAGPDAERVAFEPTAPLAPALTPCPGGWREVAPDGVTRCDPWPEDGPPSCGASEAPLPGAGACVAIGTDCAADGWPADLPEGASVVFVRAGEAAGGDGTREAPLASIADAMRVGGPGTVVALSTGRFEETVRLGRGRTLWGACASGTTIATAEPASDAGVVTVAGSDTVIRNLRIEGERPGVWAVGDGVSVHLEGVILDGTVLLGWGVASGATASGHEVLVRGTRPDETGSFGQGVAVLSGGDLQLERAALVGNHHVAVSVDASSARLSDVAVVGTELEPVTGSFGRAISAQSGGQVHAERVALDENHEAAVLSADDGTLVTLTDAVIRGTILAPIATGGGGSSGDGVIVRFGAAAELSRVWLDDESLVGIGVAEEGSRLTARDVVLEGTEADEAGFFGQGLLVERGASAELERAVIARSPHIGVSIEGVGSTLSLRDVLVRDGLGQPADGLFGRGLNVQDGAAVTLERAALASNRDVSIFVGGEGATLRGSDVTVTDTARRACAPGCSEAGVGIGAYVGGLIDLRAFAVRRAALTGVQVARDGAMDLHDGEIAESPIGANVQVDDYDLTRLQDGVAYRDNDRNLDAATLPVPDFEAGHP